MPTLTRRGARAALAAIVLLTGLFVSVPAGVAAYQPAKRVQSQDLRLAVVRLAQRPVKWSGPTPLTVSFTSTPTDPTTATSATFAWQGTFGASFRCSLDNASPSTCSSPTSVSGLASGKHTFSVTAQRQGNRSTAVDSWTVQAAAPPPPSAPTGGGSSGSSGGGSTGGSSGGGSTGGSSGGGSTGGGSTGGGSTGGSTGGGSTDTTAPSVPAGLTVSSITASNAAVAWTASSDAVGVTGYDVFLGGAKKGQTAATSYQLGSLACGSSYTVAVDAYDAAGNVSQQASTSFQTTACPASSAPSAPSVAAPKGPSSYQIPSDATLVTSSAQLNAALANSSIRDVALADGTYDNSSAFNDQYGTHLYAQHLGRAVLTAGLVVGGNASDPGATVQGLAFDVTSSSKTLQGGEIITWGNAGQNVHVLDCTFDGNGAVPIGLYALNPDGLDAERLTFTHFTDEGIRASNNVQVGYGSSTPRIALISDISVDGVSRSTPGSSQGTAESGIWIGHPVAGGVHRIRIRNVSWSGIETVNNAWDTTFTDLDIDMSGQNSVLGVAFYMEHYSRNLVIDGFRITGSDVGIKAEWDDPSWGGVAAAHNTTIRNGSIDASGWNHSGHTVGLFLDQGTESTAVSGVTFANMNFAAIDAFNVVGTNTFAGNSYQLASGVPQISNQHM